MTVGFSNQRDQKPVEQNLSRENTHTHTHTHTHCQLSGITNPAQTSSRTEGKMTIKLSREEES